MKRGEMNRKKAVKNAARQLKALRMRIQMLHHENIFHVQDLANVVQHQVNVLGLGGGIRVRVESLGIHIVVEIVVHQLRIGVLLYLLLWIVIPPKS